MLPLLSPLLSPVLFSWGRGCRGDAALLGNDSPPNGLTHRPGNGAAPERRGKKINLQIFISVSSGRRDRAELKDGTTQIDS